MVIGEHQKFASALVVPDFEVMGKWCDAKNIAFSRHEEMICMPEVQMAFQSEINTINKKLSDHERLHRFRLVSDIWTPESGELSPTLKLKRKVVSDKYALLIKDIYNK
jgi:long-chain acyl-CoA synthetase